MYLKWLGTLPLQRRSTPKLADWIGRGFIKANDSARKTDWRNQFKLFLVAARVSIVWVVNGEDWVYTSAYRRVLASISVNQR
jgi:hypothetical protein